MPVDLFVVKKRNRSLPGPRPPFFNYVRGPADNHRPVVKMRMIKGDSASAKIISRGNANEMFRARGTTLSWLGNGIV